MQPEIGQVRKHELIDMIRLSEDAVRKHKRFLSSGVPHSSDASCQERCKVSPIPRLVDGA